MNKKELQDELIKLGWDVFPDLGTSGKILVKTTSDGIMIGSNPSIVRLPTCFKVRVNNSFATQDLIDAYKVIFEVKKKKFYSVMSIGVGDMVYIEPEFMFSTTPKDAAFTINNLIEKWGRDQKVDSLMSQLISIGISAPGDWPARHLAALAVAGDVNAIERYIEIKKHENVNWVTYISLEHIKRALEVAMSHTIDRSKSHTSF